MANTIKEFYFFKTPFDNTYKNVPYFMSNATNAQIFNFFYTSFPGFKWLSNPINISLKETNGKILLHYGGASNDVTNHMLTGKQIKDYNYCCIKWTPGQGLSPKYYFYFVTGYSTLNQGTYPSTELSLEYDVWVNNFSEIANNKPKYHLTKATINSYFIKDNKAYIDNNFSSKEVPTITSINPFNKNPSSSSPTPLLSNPVLLWLKVTLDGAENVYIKNNGDEAWTKASNVGVFSSASQLPVVYYPIAVLSPNGLDLETDTYSVEGFYNRSLTNSTTLTNFRFTLNGLHIVDASITAYPPFQVSYADHKFTIFNRFNFSQLSYENGSNFPVTFTDPVNGNRHYCVYLKESDYDIDWDDQYTYDANIYVNKVLRYNTGEMDEDAIVSSSCSLRIPYNNYLKLDICGTQYNIIPPANTYYYRIRIKHIESGSYIYVVYYNTLDTEISRSPYMRISEVGGIPVVSDSLSVYMRNNGNSYAAKSYEISAKGYTNALNKVVGIGIAAAHYNVSGVIEGALQLNQTLLDTELAKKALNAKIQDVNNQRDSIQPVSNNSIENIFRNQVIIYKITPRFDSYDAIQLAYDEHYYGVNCNVYDTINKKYKKYFDYKQYESISIPSIYNIQERNLVERILREGTTFWYTDPIITDGIINQLKALNKNIANEVN